MSINNLNPRRTVWFSPREPLNKYDIWLSKNAHLDENGEPTVDSNVQRDCDYIFKIYDCGKWNPIVGFNSTAKFKINTVANVPYEYTYNGETYTSNSIEQFHLPLFREPNDSPAELFDAGTVYLVLKKFVSSEEWGDIFEGDIINSNLEPAAHEYLGGIWADMFSSSTHADASTANNTYLAQAKYKYQSTLNDYNLYTHAKDILKAIYHYQEDHSDDDVTYENMLFLMFLDSSSIMKGWRLIDINEHPTQLDIEINKPMFLLGGDPTHVITNRGKFIRAKKPDDEWYDYHNHQPYSMQNHCWDYVDIFDEIGGEDSTPSQERVPIKGLYGINATYRTFSDNTEGYALKLSGYDSNTPNQMYCRTTTYTIPDNNRDQVPNEWLYADEHGSTNRGLEWISGPDMIKEETGYDENTMGNKKVYLCCDHETLGWDDAPESGESYIEGYGIEFGLQNTQTSINQSIELIPIIPIDENPCSITWRGEYNYLVFSNGEDTTNVYIYNYIHVAGVGSKGFTIDLIDGNSQFFNPNPIYIYLEASGSNNFIPLNNNVITGNDVSLTNGSFGQSGEKYLITIQFGAIKIELIKPITQ